MFKFIDLFAGIGGMRIPFEKIGGECVFTSEMDKYAQITYQENFGSIPEGDITEIHEQEIPAHDLLLAGFPCQAFSQAGKREGFEDTRGTLFFDIARILDFHRPKAFLLENVKGLKNHDQGKTLQTIVRVLNKMNYCLFIEVLNAKHFGLPQNRERIFIVGFKEMVNFQFPLKTKVKTRLGDILDKDIDIKYTISDKLWKSHKARKKKAKEKGYGFGYSLFNEESEYTSTISARYYKDGSEILIEQEDHNPRMLTPREAARLQGFPRNFKIPVSNVQAYKQFGNSVPINVINAIAKNMKPFLS